MSITFKLGPNNPKQKNAIDNKLPLQIDSNLENEKIIALKGAYLFDSSIGSFGGYKVKVLMK